ncbi:MAG: hypothetical protein WC749_15900, partial [Dehalococcoidia bacterium]
TAGNAKIPIADGSGKLDTWITLGASLDDTKVPDNISIDNTRLYAPAGAGNVGIGTTSPLGLLQVAGTGNVIFNQSGNVGIGTTSPQSKLAVLGGISVGTATYTGKAAPTSGMIIEGNVGVGTTAPVQKLHVEGQCVTGDTLLPVIRRDVVAQADVVAQFIGQKSGQPRPDKSGNYSEGIQYIPITDVKPGDLVLSLNEETGTIEPHRINGLLDMGVKPVFRMTTADGRTIRTTGNHPYLTKDGWKKVVELKAGDEIAAARETFSQINERALFFGGHEAQIGFPQMLPATQLRALPFFFTSFFRMEPETNKHQNEKRNSTAHAKQGREFFEKGARQTYGKNSFCQVANKFTDVFLSPVFNFAHQQKIYHGLFTLSSRLLFPVEAYATQAPMPAILWVKIASLDYVGYEQVYDIEVEGTHNFVANGIIAHNTYIKGAGTAAGISFRTADSTGVDRVAILDNGNVGIGTTAPVSLLDVNQKLNVLSGGNVGIGTTLPAYKLEVTGDIRATGSIYGNVAGGYAAAGWVDDGSVVRLQTQGDNVGIGLTNPTYKLDVSGTMRVSGTGTIGVLTLTNPLAIAQGGTGATDTTTARSSLGLAISTNVQAYDAGLQSIAGLTTAADQMIYTTALDAYTTTGLTTAGRAILDDVDAVAQRTTLGAMAPADTLTGLVQSVASGTSYITGGNIGIGTVSPTAKLHLRGAGTSTGFALRIADSTPTDRLVVLDKGYVGIGTTNPVYELDVTGSIRASSTIYGNLATGPAGSIGGSVIKDTDADTWVHTELSSGLDKVIIATAGTHKLAVTSDGNVGIGLTNPAYKLDINGSLNVESDGIRLASSVPSVTTAKLYNDSTTLKWNGSPLAIGGSLSGTERFLPRYTSSNSIGDSVIYQSIANNIGIGLTNPAEKLDVLGNLKVSGTATTTNLTIGSLSGILKASSGAVTGSATLDDIADGTNYKRLAANQISSSNYIDATTSAKGIASFNSTNFSVASGAVNTIQGISTSA